MEAILAFKNGYCDILHTSFEFPADLVSKESLISWVSDDEVPDGIYKVTILKHTFCEGQYGDYGVCEFPAYIEIDSATCERIRNVKKGFITKEEAEENQAMEGKQRAKELQAWVKSHSTDTTNYDLCSVWGHDLELCTYTDGIFRMSSTIKKFDSSATTAENCKAIKDWCEGYFASLKVVNS